MTDAMEMNTHLIHRDSPQSDATDVPELSLPTTTPPTPNRTPYIVVGVVAAAVSAATVAYVFWARARHTQSAESVQDLLDLCRNQVREIEQRLGELHQITSSLA